jgi:hypothetical protein
VQLEQLSATCLPLPFALPLLFVRAAESSHEPNLSQEDERVSGLSIRWDVHAPRAMRVGPSGMDVAVRPHQDLIPPTSVLSLGLQPHNDVSPQLQAHPASTGSGPVVVANPVHQFVAPADLDLGAALAGTCSAGEEARDEAGSLSNHPTQHITGVDQ